MKKSPSCDMRSCLMCRMTLTEWKPVIAAHKKNFVVKRGEQIIAEGDPVNGVFFVTSGNVKVHKKWGDKELILRFANAGKIFGHRGLGSDSGVYPISATALEKTELCFIPLDFFKTTLKVNADFMYNLLLFYAEELQSSERKMRNLALMPVKNRLAVALINLQVQFGLDEHGFINVELSRQDLAAYAGATYETVFRTLNDIVSENLILIKGKNIQITNEAGLELLTHG
ncbi:CRP/FNR family transcriptional regulator [Pedobacter sp. CAN_A7]|uniref:Crp/Fnr family transcriptional regulator n=1 Tax=Pedobacter sp. CAN_A7 TaxID=2787722 RepID=UPI0018CB9548